MNFDPEQWKRRFRFRSGERLVKKCINWIRFRRRKPVNDYVAAIRDTLFRFRYFLTASAGMILLILAASEILSHSPNNTRTPVSVQQAKSAADNSVSGFLSETHEDQDHQAESVRDFINSTEESVKKLKETREQSLREEYRQILDRGEGDQFTPSSSEEAELWEEVREQRKTELQEDPCLLLVNKWHYLPEDYEVDPVTLPNGQMIGSTCYEALMDMLDDCAEAGGSPIVCSGYRAHWKQVDLFDAQINRWLYAGYDEENAQLMASTAVAVPGTSEHELGLAADIYSTENMDLDESQIYTVTQQWLMNNCWKYGFILRYPKDKSEITGIIFEPWHYRYVGVEHAKKIFDAEICLEEYLDETDHPAEDIW